MNTFKILTLVSANLAAAFMLLSPAAAGEMDIVDTAISSGNFNTLVAAADAAGLVEALRADGPITVFAPTDEAFAKLPAGTVEDLLKPENIGRLQAILKYHVLPGAVMSNEVAAIDSAPTLLGQNLAIRPAQGNLYIDNASVTAADIKASNGVIHVIDSVLIPGDIVAVAASAGSFNTLAAAINAAGLAETLSTGGPFTVFAPTDEAFAKLPAGTVENLLKPENREQLVAILTYHVVPGAWLASDVVTMDQAPSVNGMPLWIEASDAGVSVSGSTVVATDIQALNGVIHVIDTVMIPDMAAATHASWQSGSSCGH